MSRHGENDPHGSLREGLNPATILLIVLGVVVLVGVLGWLSFRADNLDQRLSAAESRAADNAQVAKTLEQQVLSLGETPAATPTAAGPTAPPIVDDGLDSEDEARVRQIAAQEATRQGVSAANLNTVVTASVKRAVEAMPPPEDGKDAPAPTREQLIDSTREVVTALYQANPPSNGSDGSDGANGRGIASVATSGCFVSVTFTDGISTDVGPFCGKDGADGRSAYQVWLDEGNTGTVADYLNSLKGVGITRVQCSQDGLLQGDTEFTITYSDGRSEVVQCTRES